MCGRRQGKDDLLVVIKLYVLLIRFLIFGSTITFTLPLTLRDTAFCDIPCHLPYRDRRRAGVCPPLARVGGSLINIGPAY